MKDCGKRLHLAGEVQRALADMIEPIQREVIKMEVPGAIGALYQHRGEHGC
jgi:hypothetical protein